MRTPSKSLASEHQGSVAGPAVLTSNAVTPARFCSAWIVFYPTLNPFALIGGAGGRESRAPGPVSGVAFGEAILRTQLVEVACAQVLGQQATIKANERWQAPTQRNPRNGPKEVPRRGAVIQGGTATARAPNRSTFIRHRVILGGRTTRSAASWRGRGAEAR